MSFKSPKRELKSDHRQVVAYSRGEILLWLYRNPTTTTARVPIRDAIGINNCKLSLFIRLFIRL